MSGGRIGQDPGIGTARHLDIAERVGDRKELFECARHGPLAGAAGEHKRAVDVEEEDGGRRRF